MGLQVYIETYRDSMQGVRAPVQAALTQMLNNFVETLREIEDKVVRWCCVHAYAGVPVVCMCLCCFSSWFRVFSVVSFCSALCAQVNL